MRQVDASIIIDVPAKAVIDAFTDPAYLKGWWGVHSSLVQPVPGGLYLLAWKGNEGFSYVNTGIIKGYEAGIFIDVEKLCYLSVEKQILGPMSLLIECSPHNSATYVHICQGGYQSGGDWDWFYDAVVENWPIALQNLKNYLEAGQ
jgi:uncharacterized protein YndB with AHSA1/START domain